MKNYNCQKYLLLFLYLFLILTSLLLPGFVEELKISNNIVLLSLIGPLNILILIIFYKKEYSLFVPLLFFVLCLILSPLISFQKELIKIDFCGVNYLFPIIIYFCVVAYSKKFRNRISWLNWGKLVKKSIYFIIPVILLSSAALILWTFLLNPDISKFVKRIPEWNIYLLMLGGIGFSILNSLAEEFIFRGVIWDGLNHILKGTTPVIILQALLFGLWHYHGFPGGFIGSSMVFIWGILLGILRNWSKGMLAPILTHFFADITIFMILITI